jgi:hypothetical protein
MLYEPIPYIFYTCSLLEKSKLAQHAYEEGHRVGWDDARVLEIESKSKDDGKVRKP